MKSDVLKKIAISEEVLSVLPKNTDNNISTYLKEANKIYAAYNKSLLEVIEEMKQRNKIIDNLLKENPLEIKDLKSYLADLKLLNPLTTPYEKLNFDRYLFHLSDECGSELKEINEYIIETIKIFKQVGVNLTIADFYYGEAEKNYMASILDYEKYSYFEVKEVFEKNYWNSPNMINNIQLNFKTLYFKNFKLFENYIANLIKKKNLIYNDVLKQYKKELITKQLDIDKNEKYFLDKFINQELNIQDYVESNIKSLIEKIFDNVTPSVKVTDDLYNTLLEYKLYNKFADIFELFRQDLAKVSKNNRPQNIIKEILKLDKKILKAKNNNQQNLDKLKSLYLEYDELYYLELLRNNVSNSAKILDLIFIITSHYKFYYKISKRANEELTNEEILANHEQLYNLYLSPYNNLINHLNIQNGFNLCEIVCEKYKLNNINITEKDLHPDNLVKTIKEIFILMNYTKIAELEKIDYHKICEYYKFNEILKEIE